MSWKRERQREVEILQQIGFEAYHARLEHKREMKSLIAQAFRKEQTEKNRQSLRRMRNKIKLAEFVEIEYRLNEAKKANHAEIPAPTINS